jgi:hypothetical protein
VPTRHYPSPVSDHSDNDIEHDEWAKEDEGDEVEVGDRRPAPPLRVCDVQLPVLNITVGGFKLSEGF